MTETRKSAVAAAPDFGNRQHGSPAHERYPNTPRLTLSELDAISEALHAMRGEINADTRAEAEALRAVLASANAKILAMRERRRGGQAIDAEIDAALVAIDAAMEACADGPSMTDREPAFVV